MSLANWWEGEEKIGLRRVCDLYAGKISVKSVRRWCVDGLLKSEGVRIRLESWKEGGERFTTVEAYRRFVAKQNE